ncbi:MAG: nickel-dependent lactate racemase [Archaeoglobaceae archaeon]|nr:nickel-dependent lactate racemase [Archaeoglobaceae archaeon]
MKEIIFNGDDVLIYDFPNEVDIVYPPPILKTHKSPLEIVKNAINSVKIESFTNSKIVIAFDDVSLPFPLSKEDPRKLVITELIKKLKENGVGKDQLKLICATGLHRKCTKRELKFLLGNISSKYKILNHDCRETTFLGETESGYVVEVNKHLVEADLLIYVSIPFLPMNGGWKSIAVGLGSYECIRQHHLPEVLEKSSYMNPSSEMHKIINEIGRFVADQISIIQIELVVNNDFYSGFISKSWNKLNGENKVAQKFMISLSNAMPHRIKSYIRNKYKAGYKLAFASAGEIDEIHPEILKKIYEHRGLKINRKYDAIIFGLPNMSPYSVNSEINPILFHTMVRGYLCNMFESMLRKNGVFVVQNPLREFFDQNQHPAYRELYYKYIAKGKIEEKELESAEKELVANSELMERYANGFAYHPAHAVIAYYWGTLGLKKLEKVIVVGSRSKAAKILGMESAKNMDEAIKLLRELGCNDIAYIFMPPIFFVH